MVAATAAVDTALSVQLLVVQSTHSNIRYMVCTTIATA